jgi:hypothetical protein
VETLLILAILVPLIFANLFMGLFRFFGSGFGKLVGRLIPEEEMANPRVDALRARMGRLLKRAKLLVGLVGVVLGVSTLVFGTGGVDLASLAAVVALAIAFHHGADLSRVLVYARHDASLMRQRRDQATAKRLLVPILALGLVGNALFITLWAVLFFVIQAGAKAAMGVGVAGWALGFWVLGLAMGTLVARRVARLEPGFLLREELGVGLFLGLVRLHAAEEAGRQAVRKRLDRHHHSGEDGGQGS